MSSAALRILCSILWIGALCLIWRLLLPIEDWKHVTVGLLATYFLSWGLCLALAKSSGNSFAKRSLLLTCTFIFMGMMAEGLTALRIVDWRVPFGTVSIEPWRQPWNRHDPILLHTKAPHFTYRETLAFRNVKAKDHQPFDVHYDANGFRNDEFPNQADFVVIGDSFVEGPFVQSHQVFTTLLSAKLDSTIVNLGQCWYGPQQELEVLKRFALPLKPKVVVWMFFEGNDLIDQDRYDSVIGTWDQVSPTYHTFIERSFVRNLSERLRVVFSAPDKRYASQFGILSKVSGSTNVQFDYPPVPMNAKWEGQIKRLRGILEEANALCVSNHVKLLVCFSPTKYRVLHSICEFPTESSCRTWGQPQPRGYIRELVEGISNRIAFLDMTDGLVEDALQGRQPYFMDDSHWAESGHQSVAKQLELKLKSMIVED